MKKNIVVLSIFVSFIGVQSQNFEGIIQWSIESKSVNKNTNLSAEKNNVTDQNTSNAKQEMLSQLKNPDIANNPQAKEMIEKMIAQLSISEDSEMNLVSGFMPTGLKMKYKNGNTLTEMQGGLSAMLGEILTLKDKKVTYILKKKERKFSIIPENNTKNNLQKTEVIKTNEKISILGYNCLKYQLNTEFSGNKMTQFAYITTDLKGIDALAFKGMRVSQNDNGISEALSKINGIPLKMEINFEGNYLVLECKSIKKMTLQNSDFLIPSTFKETKMVEF